MVAELRMGGALGGGYCVVVVAYADDLRHAGVATSSKLPTTAGGNCTVCVSRAT